MSYEGLKEETSPSSRFDPWKPAASRTALKLMAMIMWLGVGLLLGRWVYRWLSPLGWFRATPWLAAGLALSSVMQLFFSRFARRNIDRIDALPTRPCLFAFQAWTSYPLVAFMIGLGLLLRRSPLPRTWLATLYFGIGGGLFLAGWRYAADLQGWPHRRAEP